jgi:prepilin-type N-terminal cleavage/methylation domain-containing protein
MERRKQQGFSLIELLVVVAIMLVIAAIAVPAVVSATQSGNENSAANTLKTVATAENGYHGLYSNFPLKAASLGGINAPGTGCPSIPTSTGGCFIADGIAKQLDAGTMAGYTYAYIPPTDGQEWSMSATPSSSYSGRKAYFVSTDGTVSYTTCAAACPAMTAPGTPLGQ